MSADPASPRTSRLRRWELAVSVLNLVAAVLDGIRFWRRHESLDAMNAGLFLALAIVFMLRNKRSGELQIAKLNIEDLKGKP